MNASHRPTILRGLGLLAALALVLAACGGSAALAPDDNSMTQPGDGLIRMAGGAEAPAVAISPASSIPETM